MYVQYTNPAGYPPLQHSSRILAEKGFQVLFLGSGAQGAGTLDFPFHPRIRVKQLRFREPGWRQKLHYAAFGLWTLLWVLFWRPRWIYASDPLSCPVAALLSFVPGLRVLYHEHDSPNGIPNSKFESLVMKLRRKVARRADICILPNENRADRFKSQTGTERPVVCVWNCPAVEEAIERTALRDGDSFVIFFHGSIVPARLPLAVIEALKSLPDQVVLHVAGYETIGHAGYIQALQDHARRLGIEERFRYLGAFSRYSLFAHCRNASVGLSLMPLNSIDVNEQAMTGASNKPFDYLGCGLPLLVSDLPEWRKMFVDPGYGLACDPEDPSSIANAVRWFLNNNVKTHTMGLIGRRRILNDWNYQRQFEPVLAHFCAATL